MELGNASEYWIYVLSSIAGAVGFTQNFSFEESWRRNLLKLLGRIIVSIFAGVMSLHAARWVGVNGEGLFLAVGIGAWRGDKGLQVLADWWDRFFGKKTDGGKGE